MAVTINNAALVEMVLPGGDKIGDRADVFVCVCVCTHIHVFLYCGVMC